VAASGVPVPMADSRALDTRRILYATLVVLFGFLASGVLGFVRTAVINAQFGTSATLDAFYAAQQIPELIFVLVAGGALGSSFIPVYARMRETADEDAWRLASAVLTLATLAALVLGAGVAIAAPWLVENLLLRGASDAVQALTIELIRPMMVTPMIFAASGLIMGILQSHGLFLLPSVAISMNNIGLIIGALFIAERLPAAEGIAQAGSANVYGLVIGTILAALLHLGVQLPGLVRIRARLRLLLAVRVQGVRDVLWLMIPRVLGLAVTQINFLVNIALTASMVDGSYVALRTAFTLMYFALGIIGQSVGTAVFPTLAALASQGDWDAYKMRLAGAMRAVLFVALPATAAMMVLAVPLVSIYERGQWTAESTAATAWALTFYATGIAGFALLEILNRAFYALSDTATPVTIGVLAMIANIIASLALIQVMGDPDSLARGPFAGLALANAATTLVEAGILWFLMYRRVRQRGGTAGLYSRSILNMLVRSALAAGVMAIVLVLISSTLAAWPGLAIVLVCAPAGAIVYLAAGIVLNVEEARGIPRALGRRLGRRRAVAATPVGSDDR
jgi:putative peptidoglycan lipid II flippase